MRVPLGATLAVVALLVGAPGAMARGGTTGGGGGATVEEAAPKQTGQRTETQAQLQEAMKSANKAHENVAKQDWNSALKDIGDVRNKLRDAEKRASADAKADLRNIEQQAAKAEASIRTHADRAGQDVKELVTRINQLATRKAPVEAGGGKPTQKGTQQ